MREEKDERKMRPKQMDPENVRLIVRCVVRNLLLAGINQHVLGLDRARNLAENGLLTSLAWSRSQHCRLTMFGSLYASGYLKTDPRQLVSIHDKLLEANSQRDILRCRHG